VRSEVVVSLRSGLLFLLSSYVARDFVGFDRRAGIVEFQATCFWSYFCEFARVLEEHADFDRVGVYRAKVDRWS